MNNNKLMEPFTKQYDFMNKYLSQDKVIKIGTMGPNTTSSVQALMYLCKYLGNKDMLNIKLYENFNQVLNSIESSNELDLVLIPNVYEKISYFFWNRNLENCFNFIFPTPEYGLVCKKEYVFKKRKTIKIATCHAVEHMVNALSNGFIEESCVEKYITPSTTAALKELIKGNVDMAITNETSFNIYKNENIKFIFQKTCANIIWCLFKRRNNICI